MRPTTEFGIVTKGTPLNTPVFVASSRNDRPDRDTSSLRGYEVIGTEERRDQIMEQQANWRPHTTATPSEGPSYNDMYGGLIGSAP